MRIAPESNRVIPGLNELRQRDAGFSSYQISDRAAVAFYRYHQARRTGSVDALHSIAMPDMMQQFIQEQGEVLANCALGMVRLNGVLSDERGDRCLVEVRYSGQHVHRGADGRELLGQSTAPRKFFFVMYRRPGAETKLDQAFNSAHCPSCGAPDEGEPQCRYCGAPMGVDSDAWLLDQVLPWSSTAAHELKSLMRGKDPGAKVQGRSAIASDAGDDPDSLIEQGGSAVVSWAVSAAMADGQVDNRERACLQALGERFGLTAVQVDSIISSAQAGTLITPEPKTLIRRVVGCRP